MSSFNNDLHFPSALMDPLLLQHVHSYFYHDIQPSHLLIIEHSIGIKMHIYENYVFCILNFGLYNAECLMLQMDSSTKSTDDACFGTSTTQEDLCTSAQTSASSVHLLLRRLQWTTLSILLLCTLELQLS
ncbi:hypothetical protein DFH28DRAFT_1118359 [Melampsora americana]|nr:hypothetical protein DFH28DRAFT_1118359 [Melampsora americana]